MAYRQIAHLRQFGKKKLQPGRLRRNWGLILFCVVCALTWSRRAVVLGDSEKPELGQFSYGKVTLERVLDYVGDGESEFDRRSREERESRERRELEMARTEVEEEEGRNGDVAEGDNRDERVEEKAQVGEQVENEIQVSDKEKKVDVEGGGLANGQFPVDVDAAEKAESVIESANSTEILEQSNVRQDVAQDSDQVVESDTSVKMGLEEPDSVTPVEHKEEHQDEQRQQQQPIKLEQYLNFTNKTAINFMHFHKTGGVSFKTALHKFYNNKFKKDGTPVIVRDACYMRSGVTGADGKPSFALWRCDWEPIRQMSAKDRNKHDFVFGHQFWDKGAGHLLDERDLRTFTVLRHPFDRKVSFFYHFFVREMGRKEEDVSFEEIRKFLLHDELTADASLGRDLGPNYMAGRLLSDGEDGFVGNNSFRYYHVDQQKKGLVAEKALDLVRGYAFVGLQRQNDASKCMLRKMMQVWNDVNGVSNDGLDEIEAGKKLNSGSYSMTASDIWRRLSMEDRIWFDRKERVDITIYEEGENLFNEHVRVFGCTHKLTS